MPICHYSFLVFAKKSLYFTYYKIHLVINDINIRSVTSHLVHEEPDFVINDNDDIIIRFITSHLTHEEPGFVYKSPALSLLLISSDQTLKQKHRNFNKEIKFASAVFSFFFHQLYTIHLDSIGK